jgi:antitoxin component YwqK of YwqJK toxin-antitoxin module
MNKAEDVNIGYWRTIGRTNVIKYEIGKLNNLWHGKVKLYDTKGVLDVLSNYDNGAHEGEDLEFLYESDLL